MKKILAALPAASSRPPRGRHPDDPAARLAAVVVDHRSGRSRSTAATRCPERRIRSAGTLTSESRTMTTASPAPEPVARGTARPAQGGPRLLTGRGRYVTDLAAARGCVTSRSCAARYAHARHHRRRRRRGPRDRRRQRGLHRRLARLRRRSAARAVGAARATSRPTSRRWRAARSASPARRWRRSSPTTATTPRTAPSRSTSSTSRCPPGLGVGGARGTTRCTTRRRTTSCSSAHVRRRRRRGRAGRRGGRGPASADAPTGTAATRSSAGPASRCEEVADRAG